MQSSSEFDALATGELVTMSVFVLLRARNGAGYGIHQ